MSTTSSSGPCRGRNCGKNEIANTAAFGFAAIDTSDARKAAPGPRPRARQPGTGRRLLTASADRLNAERDQHHGADDVHRVEQDRVRDEQRGETGAAGDRPAEQPELVAGDGGDPGRAPVPDRAVEEQRRGRAGQRRQHDAGEQERGQDTGTCPTLARLCRRGGPTTNDHYRPGPPGTTLANMTTIYAATGTDIIRFELETAPRARPSASWRTSGRCASPSTHARLSASTSARSTAGLFVSEDRGATWDAPERPPEESRVLSVAVSPAADHAYAGTEPSNLYRSEDHGGSWERLPALRELPSEPTWSFPPRPWTHHVRTIAPHPADPAQLSVGIELGGVMRSADGGASWLDHNPQAHSDAHALLTHPGPAGSAV